VRNLENILFLSLNAYLKISIPIIPVKPTKFPNLIKGSISRGYSNQEIKKLAGENFLRLFKKVVG